eukprot:765986-Hanusia_phi.AAC.1
MAQCITFAAFPLSPFAGAAPPPAGSHSAPSQLSHSSYLVCLHQVDTLETQTGGPEVFFLPGSASSSSAGSGCPITSSTWIVPERSEVHRRSVNLCDQRELCP